MVKALADRLAEAFAEYLHERVRKEFWAYAPDENLSNDERTGGEISRHQAGAGLSGPARPYREADDFRSAGGGAAHRGFAHRKLRHACRARRSAASISRIRNAHYFGVAKVERDQVEDYAARKKMTVAEVERWLAPGAELHAGALERRFSARAVCAYKVSMTNSGSGTEAPR